jgi:probable DNA repair protein
MAEDVLFEPEELRAPLLVIDAETCAGMAFDGLWVCGLDDAKWPPAASPDPFLPRAWQVRQHVPGCTAGIAEEDARRLLTRLCRSADDVILSVPQFDDDAPLLASALLDGIPESDLPALWAEQSMAVATFAARPVLETEIDGSMPRVAAGEAARGGARLLELQAACPFRAQAEQRLGARALEETELGLDAAARGDLVHSVLARLWDELRDREGLRALSLEAAGAAVRRVIAAELAAAHRNAEGVRRHLLDIEARWLESRVLELLAVERGRTDFAVEAVERAVTISIGGLALELRPDRIDRLEDGSLAVIDYKTGADAEPAAWLDERPKLPQLPLYATALGADRVAAVAFARVRTGDTGYSGLASNADSFPGLKSPGARGWPREFGSWQEMLEHWRQRLSALAVEHVTGDARLAPDPKHACEYCHLGALCRIAETRSGRAGEDVADD